MYGYLFSENNPPYTVLETCKLIDFLIVEPRKILQNHQCTGKLPILIGDMPIELDVWAIFAIHIKIYNAPQKHESTLLHTYVLN